MARLNAEVDEATRRELYHALLDDGLTFAEWMRRQIDAYLAAHPHTHPKEEAKEAESGRQGTHQQKSGFGARSTFIVEGERKRRKTMPNSEGVDAEF
jgi:hypothetical protein